MKHLSESEYKRIVGRDNNIEKYKEFLDKYYKFSKEIFNANLLTFSVVEEKSKIYFLHNGTEPFCEKIIGFIKAIRDNQVDNPFFTGGYTIEEIEKCVSFICSNMFKIYENYCPKSYSYPEQQVEYDTIARIKIFKIFG